MPFVIKLCCGNPEQCQVILLLGYGSAVVTVDVRVLGNLEKYFVDIWCFQQGMGQALALPGALVLGREWGREALVTSTLSGKTKAQNSNTTPKS